MAIASELSIRTAIVEGVRAVSGSGKVHSRYLRGLDGQESTYNNTFIDDSGRLNSQMVRRVQRIPVIDKHNRLVSVMHVYAILFNVGIAEEAGSEEVVQLLIENIATWFEEHPTLGLDGVTHHQIEMPRFADSELGGKKVHSPELRLVVDAEDC